MMLGRLQKRDLDNGIDVCLDVAVMGMGELRGSVCVVDPAG